MRSFHLSKPVTFMTIFLLAIVADAEVSTKSSSKALNGIKNQQSVASISARETSNLRCWQYGELLFEKTHLKDRKLSTKNPVLVFEETGRKNQKSELHLIEMGTATCLYEKI